ncbi:MAG: hypothetical protein B7X43_04975, partial [Thiomonas sp. 15-63-373]
PPLWSKRNAKGELIKREFGPWMGVAFRLLAPLKVLRGTALDPFGHTAERKQERALIGQYRETIAELLRGLNANSPPERLQLATQIARLPDGIRGYGHIKQRYLAQVLPQWEALMRKWRQVTAGASSPDSQAVPETVA